MGEEEPKATLILELPLPPTINQQYATVGRRRVLSWTAKHYKKIVIKQLRRQYQSGRIEYLWASALRRGFLALRMTFYFKTPLLRDLDGGLKIAQDALCEAFQVNDNRVVELHLRKQVDAERPRLEVRVTILPEWDFHSLTVDTTEEKRIVIEEKPSRRPKPTRPKRSPDHGL